MSEDAAILRRVAAFKTRRAPNEPQWVEAFNYTLPVLGNGLNGSVVQDAAQANTIAADVYDSTAADGMRTLASNVMDGLTPANALWFAMDVGEETPDERRWLDDSAKTLWENIHQANFDAEGYEGVLDLVGAGWFVLYIDEDREVGGLVFEKWPLAQCYVGSSRTDGRIDTIGREFELTAEQAVKEYGEDQVSPETALLAKEKPDEKVKFLHWIAPRPMHVVGARLAKNLPFQSKHIELAKVRCVREGGYHEFPCIVPRWHKLPSGYGIGPMAVALPDIRTLNKLLELELDNADIAVSGMWIAEDDGVLNPRAVKIGARKIIVANSVDSMKPLTSGARFDISFTKGDQLRANIRKILMADQLQPQDGPAMTATEVHVRVNLIRKLLGPIYGRLQAEYLRPLIERCFGLAYRAGVFSAPPPSLANRNFAVRYVSPMARAQRLEDVSAMDAFEDRLAMQMQVNPDAADIYDQDEANRLRAQLTGVPGLLLRKKTDLTRLRDEKRKQREDAEQQEMMAQGAMQLGGAKKTGTG